MVALSTLRPQSLRPLGLNFLFFRQKESLTKKNTTQGGSPLENPPFSLSWRGVSYGGTEGTEVGGSGVGGFRTEGLGRYGGGVSHGGTVGTEGGSNARGLSHGGPGVAWRGSFLRRHGGDGGGGLKCRGAFAGGLKGYVEGEFSHGGTEGTEVGAQMQGAFGSVLFQHGANTAHAVGIGSPKSYSTMNKNFYDQDAIVRKKSIQTLADGCLYFPGSIGVAAKT